MADSRIAPTGHNINIHTENYLKAIWNLSRLQSNTKELVQNSQIADYLGVKRPTVTEMLHRLKSMHFLRLTPRRGVELTKRGEKMVVEIIRRHRLVELFLQKTLGLSSVEAHKEAEVLEHVLTPELTRHIERFLDFPEYDLDGMPVGIEGVLSSKKETVKVFKACDLALGTWARVSACPDYDDKLYKQIYVKGIRVGQLLKRVDSQRVKGVVLKSKSGSRYLLSEEESELLFLSLAKN